ncbi:MAG TPA: ATP-binding protein [Vicinamibacterales bacterium]|nr:ATP-binding protein [Vicinamibacterales bacterium]
MADDDHRAAVQAATRLAILAREGHGAAGLFVGLSGTGKTLAADALRRASGAEVFHVDLRDVVSKYVGETEKNLDRIFQRAKAANVVLFFDEADALFGKRTDVRDEHDRYANEQVSYLLQRVEEIGGVAILASNQRPDMAPAVLRRFRVVWPPEAA